MLPQSKDKLIIWFDKSLNLENKCSMHVESALLIVLQQEIGIGRLSQRRLLYLCSCVTFWAQVVHPYSLLPLQQTVWHKRGHKTLSQTENTLNTM